MKSILVHANNDDALESRLQAALDLGRAYDGHITCVQVTQFQTYVSSDPFGGVYAIPEVLAFVNEEKEKNRAAVEAKLGREGAHWSWKEEDGPTGPSLVDAAHLADIILISLPGSARPDRADLLSCAGQVVVNGRTPILAVPASSRSFDCFAPAVVAWNGSPEASHALRAALPLLKKASAVHIVSVEEAGGAFPATEACHYLGWHGLEPKLHQVSAGEDSIAEVLLDRARGLGAGYIVMGAYGHSRFREAVLGGTTRDILQQDELPLFLSR